MWDWNESALTSDAEHATSRAAVVESTSASACGSPLNGSTTNEVRVVSFCHGQGLQKVVKSV
jgi:hypothetical protein